MNRLEHFFWFAAGIGLGVGSTWLMATPRGRRARRKMARMMDESCEDLQKATKNVRDRSLEMIDSGKEFVKQTGAQVGERLRFAAR